MANIDVDVLEADGVTTKTVELLGYGRQAAAASKSLALSTEDKTVLDSLDTKLSTIDGRVDGLETLITSTNTKLDTVITALQTIDSPDKGAGTGGSETQRMIIDSSQLDPTVAHDAPDSGAPYKQGFKATSSLAGLTLVANADRTDGFAGLDGVQIVRPQANLEDLVNAVVACTSGANTSAIAAQGAGVKFYLCGGMLYNNGSTAGACLLTDGTGGTTKLKVPFPASTGTVFTLPVPIGFSANTAVFADPTGSDTIDVTLYGFKSKV